MTVRFISTGTSSVDTRNWLMRTGISAKAVRRRFTCVAIVDDDDDDDEFPGFIPLMLMIILIKISPVRWLLVCLRLMNWRQQTARKILFRFVIA